MKRIVYWVFAIWLAVALAACVANRDEKDQPDREPVVLQSLPATPQVKEDGRIDAPAALKTEQFALDKSERKKDGEVSTSISTLNPAKGVAPPSQALISNACCTPPRLSVESNTEQYQHFEDNPVHLAAEQPVSTFSVDVDTGAYANVRRLLNAGQLPPTDAVRIEELINYFDYEYAPPSVRSTPFKVATEVAPAPWNSEALLLKIGIKGFEIAASARPGANLVFLIDVSGSMWSNDKLPLLKNAFHLLTDQLSAKDRVSIVVYAGNAGVVLEPTPG
jgi:Ca-activated chloride channel family protein